ncbi:MAG: adenylosuccinate synthase [Candidatus Peregrinibacteria bacterium Greene0416_62]|nr:MAG: adenylosuccinate synthase [Candidatus Peregrinibacteria bacterium Greene0416_62]TSC99581.1 MAG: adenylosuccinate synthase [Candidatus Peregrinibacteria bacterium Greene1014_49]
MQRMKSPASVVTAVIGAQWGDEGKGKLIDLLAENFDVVARACGGANAGHTIVVGGKKHVFRLLPSGCLHTNAEIVLGAGMVMHLPTLLEEIGLLRNEGMDIVPRLRISHEAHILFDFHKEIDGVLEERRSKLGKGIGTTRRGIGPAYMDKAARTGIRMEKLGEDIRGELQKRADDLHVSYGIALDAEREQKQLNDAETMLKSCVTDTIQLLHDRMYSGKRILIEGAQATLLDIDHGTYPYVTSSSTTIAGALQGLGIPPNALGEVIGVAKAYCTRVGAGEFFTEVEGSIGERLRERGGEYGSVTKRPRRCGWLHLPDLIRSAMINGFSCWNITKLDVLDTEAVIPVGMGEKNGKAIMQEFVGWKTSTVGVTAFDDLPKQAQQLVVFIEQETGIPVRYIGTGQGREEMIVR